MCVAVMMMKILTSDDYNAFSFLFEPTFLEGWNFYKLFYTVERKTKLASSQCYNTTFITSTVTDLQEVASSVIILHCGDNYENFDNCRIPFQLATRTCSTLFVTRQQIPIFGTWYGLLVIMLLNWTTACTRNPSKFLFPKIIINKTRNSFHYS